jgi:HPt (histidine-containing phosphotransfer) domain-containing protein
MGIAMIDWERVDCLRAEIGDADFGEVVDLFLEEVEEVLGRLSAQARPRQLEADLHFLKGSALNLGFADLAALCQAEERRAAAGGPIDRAPVAALYAASREAFLARLRPSGRRGQAA